MAEVLIKFIEGASIGLAFFFLGIGLVSIIDILRKD